MHVEREKIQEFARATKDDDSWPTWPDADEGAGPDVAG